VEVDKSTSKPVDAKKRLEEKKPSSSGEDRRAPRVGGKLRELTRRGKELEDRAGVSSARRSPAPSSSGSFRRPCASPIRRAPSSRRLSSVRPRSWRAGAGRRGEEGKRRGPRGRLAERDTSFAELEKRSEEAKRAALHEAAAREAETKKAIDELKRAAAQREAALTDLERRSERPARPSRRSRDARDRGEEADGRPPPDLAERDKDRVDFDKRRAELEGKCEKERADFDGKRSALEAERQTLLAEVNKAMGGAETIRREGIAALETSKTQAEQARRQAARDVEQAKTRIEETQRQAKLQIEQERRRAEDAAQAELSAEKQRLQAHWTRKRNCP